MNWQKLKTHDWQEPLAFAARFAQADDFALFYSSRRDDFSGNTSFLLLEPATQATGSDWPQLPPCGDTGDLPDWVGYIGYEMGEDAPAEPAFIAVPTFWLTRYQRLLRFDHAQQTIEEYGRGSATTPLPLTETLAPTSKQVPHRMHVGTLGSNMTRAAYQQSVRDTVAAIEAGDFYQANITRKFHGRFDHAPDGFSLFARLCAQSPSPYSAFIRHGAFHILSSSPESFLQIDEAGTITSRPIKGSIRRGNNEAEDKALAKALSASGKNLAENLMIVDLMRHDMAQVSEVGSVEVVEQSQLYSYATIHHLISTVRARLQAGINTYAAIRACFPPGSMTGAPKRAAMRWCAGQERMPRGIYSGAIGWVGERRCDLSVVIRTLILDGNCFEFQVGGGIVAESDAEDEWRETLTKARAIATVLGIEEKDLERL